MTTESTFGYVLIATGEYSNRVSTPFRVLKPFTFADALAKYKAAWTKTGWREEPDPDGFVAWLALNRYIEDTDQIFGVHVGSYSRAEVDPAVGSIVFKPPAD